MKRSVEKILEDVLVLMDSFKYEENEDRPSNSFFEAELNEDGFFILRNEIESFIKGAKNTEQQLQPDNSCEHSFSPVYQCVHCGKIGDSIA